MIRILAVSTLALGMVAPIDILAVDLKPATLAAFDRYVRLTEARLSTEVSGKEPFLWIDRQPAASRSARLARLKNGDIISERLETRDGGKEIDAPDGMIHHWIGTVLLPVQLPKARTFVQDYDRYATLFSPMIVRSKLTARTGDEFTVAMRTSMKKVITVVIDADYKVTYQMVNPTRLYTRSLATNIHEVSDAGEPGEKRVAGDRTSGFLWRLNTYCSFEQTADGTVEQCESISLTRGIPWGLGWMIRPFVSSIPRETLEFTLGRVRSEVVK